MDLQQHLQTTEDRRDRNWDENFFKMVSDSRLKLLSLDPQQGPDSWPYLMSETLSAPTAADDNVDHFQKIMFWLSEKGIGLVVNPRRLPYPDFVFSYGMIWSFRETGYFIRYDQMTNQSKTLDVRDPEKVKVGPPTEQYWPTYARKVLKSFFMDQAVMAVKVLMISADGENYDLCFSLESLGHPPESEHAGILEAISWFMPPHYSLAIVSEKQFSSHWSLI